MQSGSAVPVDRVLAPFREFAPTSAAGGLVLIGAALVALIWANSPAADSYDAVWDAMLSVEIGGLALSETLRHGINDGLMAIFFLVVGLEIKREVLVGELASVRRATLPVAVGGAALPALIFLLVAAGGTGSRGWGVPMATDIAFALGVLALLGSRAPVGLKVFLTALAIVDDLVAVLVIALFYTADLSLPALGAAGVMLALLAIANRSGVRRPSVYAVLGIALWLAVFESGIHATVAGVLLALTIPATTRLDSDAYVARARGHLADFEGRTVDGEDASTQEHHAALWELEDATASAPKRQCSGSSTAFIHGSHPVVPLFALANAGVRLETDLGADARPPDRLGRRRGPRDRQAGWYHCSRGNSRPSRPRVTAGWCAVATHLRSRLGSAGSASR